MTIFDLRKRDGETECLYVERDKKWVREREREKERERERDREREKRGETKKWSGFKI